MGDLHLIQLLPFLTKVNTWRLLPQPGGLHVLYQLVQGEAPLQISPQEETSFSRVLTAAPAPDQPSIDRMWRTGWLLGPEFARPRNSPFLPCCPAAILSGELSAPGEDPAQLRRQSDKQQPPLPALREKPGPWGSGPEEFRKPSLRWVSHFPEP